MAREFDQEFTIYLWPLGNTWYPAGHAAFKVNNGLEKRFFNYIIDVETKDQIERMGGSRNASARPLAQKLRENEIEKRFVEHTAPIKVKVPFMGPSGWGIT